MQTRREQMEFCTLFSTVSALGGNSHDLSVCENRESLGSAEEQTARTKLKMNALATQRTFATLQNYAGRFDPSHLYPLVQLKDGVKMWIEGEKEPIYALGGACSEVFGHGRQLEKINRPACKLIGDVYRSWGSGNPAESLSTHTSKGISMHLNGFSIYFHIFRYCFLDFCIFLHMFVNFCLFFGFGMGPQKEAAAFSSRHLGGPCDGQASLGLPRFVVLTVSMTMSDYLFFPPTTASLNSM